MWPVLSTGRGVFGAPPARWAGFWLLAAALVLPGVVALAGMLAASGTGVDPIALFMTGLYVAVGVALVLRMRRR